MRWNRILFGGVCDNLFSDRVLQHCAMLLQLHKASSRIWQLGLEFIVINDFFLMPVTCIGLSPQAAGVNSGDTARLAHRGARGPSPGVCDAACANTDLQPRALKLQFPDPLSPQPALLTRMPDFWGDRQATRSMLGISWVILQLVCTGRLWCLIRP